MLEKKIKNIENFDKNKKKLKMILGHFPSKISDEDLQIIKNKKYSFCYMDFDLKISTLNALQFILPRLLEGAIVIIDDYNYFFDSKGRSRCYLGAERLIAKNRQDKESK